jgi:hypothetical protein
MGATVRIPPETMAELRALRRIRNDLTHSLRLAPDSVEPAVLLDLDTEYDGEMVPTARLVRRTLRAVDAAIGSVDVALMTFANRLDEHFWPPSRHLDV